MGVGLLPFLLVAGLIYGVYRFVTQRAEMKRSGSKTSEPEWRAKPEPTGGISVTMLPDDSATAPAPPTATTRPDHRGSWIPSGAMITTRFMELRKRHGLMIALILVTIAIPSVFLIIRLLLHAFAPHSYGPAGGYSIYSGLVSGVLYVLGFIVAATLGATAGSADLGDGMFRQLVVTGRSRLALYLARIPAGLAIIGSLVAVGFTIVCAVCVFAAPTKFTYGGVSTPMNLSSVDLQSWAADHADEVICNFGFEFGPSISTQTVATINAAVNSVHCVNGPSSGPTSAPPGATVQPKASPAQIRGAAILIARMDYADYARQFLYPSTSLMVKSGLWLELEAVIGFVVGLGLGSLIGQRTVAVVLMIVLEVILTPTFSRARIPHLLNLQRALVGLATAHLAPGGLPVPGDGGGGSAGNHGLLPESTAVAVCVIVAWLVGWTVLGARRMMTRDA